MWYDLLSIGMPGELEFYLTEAKKSQGKVLELACGTGRVYLELLEAGVEAYGLDNANSMLSVLKRKAKARGIKPKIKLADMRNFRYPFKFDLVIIPYRAFLHLENRSDQKKCLENVYRHLAKGGRLILNFFDPRLDFLAAKERKIITQVKDLKSRKLIKVENYSKYTPNEQHIYAYHRLINPPEDMPRDKIEFSLTYIFPREFMNMLELCGFTKWKLYGGFNRKPYTKHGSELVWIAYR
jgi:ubiquinone/menaquinone biosynthesis C-methylase UbiE